LKNWKLNSFMSKPIEEFIVCSCSTEGLYIVKYKNEQELYFSIFNRGLNPKKMSFLTKLRYIYNLLKTGKPFNDEMILDQNSIKKLIVVLKRALSK